MIVYCRLDGKNTLVAIQVDALSAISSFLSMAFVRLRDFEAGEDGTTEELVVYVSARLCPPIKELYGEF